MTLCITNRLGMQAQPLLIDPEDISWSELNVCLSISYDARSACRTSCNDCSATGCFCNSSHYILQLLPFISTITIKTKVNRWFPSRTAAELQDSTYKGKVKIRPLTSVWAIHVLILGKLQDVQLRHSARNWRLILRMPHQALDTTMLPPTASERMLSMLANNTVVPSLYTLPSSSQTHSPASYTPGCNARLPAKNSAAGRRVAPCLRTRHVQQLPGKSMTEGVMREGEVQVEGVRFDWWCLGTYGLV